MVYSWLSKSRSFVTLVDIRDVWKSMIAVWSSSCKSRWVVTIQRPRSQQTAREYGWLFCFLCFWFPVMQALNVSHLDFSTIEQVVGGLGTVLSTERSKGIKSGVFLEEGISCWTSPVSRKWREEVGVAELQLEAFLNLRGPYTFLSLIVSLSTPLG